MIFRFLKNNLLFSIALFTANIATAQISAPGATNTVSTAYTSGATDDNIYVFCLPNQSNTDIGSLTASAPSGTGPWTYDWRQYNTGTFSFDAYSTSNGTTSTINNLPTGGYFVSVTDNGGVNVGCYIAWVFNNETNIDVAAIAAGCASFQLNGTADPIADFVYYNPPEEPSLIVDNTTDITVCFDVTHTYNSDLGFYLVSPCGQTITLSPNPGANGQISTCNPYANATNLCFTTVASGNFDPCLGTTYTGTFDSYGPVANVTPIDWSPLYGCDAATSGWQVQVYDCIGNDFGTLDYATISFNGAGACGLSSVTYDSGAITSAITDNSCTPALASIFTVPPLAIYTTPLTLANTILSFQWTSDNTCVTIPSPTSDLTPTINPVPDADTWFYLTASDNLGCPVFVDSAQFINTCPCPITNVTSTILPCNTAPGTFDITGQVIFSDPPCSGQLTVTNCSGDQQVFNPPFVSPIAYNLISITADATPLCTVTANFTNDPALCTGYSTATYTEPIAPTTVATSINLCDDGTGTATFDLTTVDATVNAATANAVSWFSDAATTTAITPATAFVSGSVTVYALISDGTCSDTTSVYLVVDPLPTATPTSMSLCDDGTGNATFDLTTLDATVNAATANAVTWFSDAGTTAAIPTPTGFSSGPTTVFATVTNGSCTDTASVYLTIAAVGGAVQTTIDLCDDGSGNATFDLTTVDATVNGGTVNVVSWFSDAATTAAIPTPTALVSGPTTVYASVTNGTCTDTASVYLTIAAVGAAVQTTMNLCDDGTGNATFDLTSVDAIVNGGTVNVVTWFSDAATTAAIPTPTALVSGSTTVFASVANGTCTDTASVYLVIDPLPTAISTSMNLCDDGTGTATFDLTTVDAIVNGATLNVVTWFSDAATTAAIPTPTALVSGSTTVYASVANGTCTDTASVYLVMDTLPTANPTIINRCDIGTGQGIFDLTSENATIDGGAANTVTWFSDAGTTIPIATPTTFSSAATTVYATITDGTCLDTTSVYLTISALGAAVQTTINACNDGSGSNTFNLTSVDGTVNGGTANTVSWFSDAALTTAIPTPTTFNSGSATVFARVVNGLCIDTASVYLVINPIPIIALTNPAAVCSPNTVDLTAAAVTAGTTAGATFTYFSDPLVTIPLAIPNAVSPTGTYYMVATIGSCNDTGSVDITINAQPVANANTDDTTCTLTYNLNAIPTDGTGTWTGPAGTVFSNLNSATSSVTVPAAGVVTFTWTEDNNTCTSSSNVTIAFSAISIPNTLTNISCYGGNTGQIVMTSQGGNAPYTYSDVVLGSNITNPYINLIAGTYTVRVTDVTGCPLDSTFVLSEPAPFTFTVDSTNANCSQPDGTISVIGFSGGTGSYTYDFGAGPTASNTASNLIPNTYSVTVTDAALPTGCDTTFTITVLNNPPFTASITNFTDATCNSLSDGTITADGSDALATYSYLWDAAASNQSTQTATGLAAGSYLVRVTDVTTGCIDSATHVISQPDTLKIGTITTSSVCGQATSSASVTLTSGGTGSYSYSWNTPTPTLSASVTNLIDGSYTLTVTDINTCTVSETITVIGKPDPVIDSITSTDISCFGLVDGEAEVFVTGYPPFTYSWNDAAAQTTAAITNLAGSNPVYTVTIMDSNNCTTSGTVQITEPDTLLLSINAPTTACYGEQIQLSASAIGGVPFTIPNAPYNFVWTTLGNATGEGPISDSPTVDVTHVVGVTDANGCISQQTHSIVVSQQLAVFPSTNTICFGETAILTATTTGGLTNATISYNWEQIDSVTLATTSEGPGSPITVSPTDTTNYIVTADDGCSLTAVEGVKLIVNPIANVQIVSTINSGCPELTVDLKADSIGGVDAILYEWDIDGDGIFDNGPISEDSISYLYTESGIYDISVITTTANGCSDTITKISHVNVFGVPVADFSTNPSIATVDVFNSEVAFYDQTLYNRNRNTTLWDFGDNSIGSISTDPSHNYLNHGIFNVNLSVSNINGCTDNITKQVIVQSKYLLVMPNSFTPDGDGLNDIFKPGLSIGMDKDTYHFLVFNRWGELIFETNNISSGWDGSFKAVQVKVDTYLWKVEVNDLDGYIHKHNGVVNVLR
jgi:gliding motility-associated-like protein